MNMPNMDVTGLLDPFHTNEYAPTWADTSMVVDSDTGCESSDDQTRHARFYISYISGNKSHKLIETDL